MKKIEIGISMIVFTMFLSCKSSINPTTTIGREDDTVTAETGDATQQTESTYDTDETAKQTESTYDNTAADPAGETPTEEMQYNGTTGANSQSRNMDMNAAPDTDYEAMFSYLEMTDDQIHQFTSAMEAYSNDANTYDTNTSDSTIEEKQDDVLSVILSPAQVEKYEAWKRDN